MNQGITQIKQMIKMLKTSGNTQMLFTQLLGQNPQIRQVIEYINSNGGDGKSLYYNLAKGKGVDPDEFLANLLSD